MIIPNDTLVLVGRLFSTEETGYLHSLGAYDTVVVVIVIVIVIVVVVVVVVLIQGMQSIPPFNDVLKCLV